MTTTAIALALLTAGLALASPAWAVESSGQSHVRVHLASEGLQGLPDGASAEDVDPWMEVFVKRAGHGSSSTAVAADGVPCNEDLPVEIEGPYCKSHIPQPTEEKSCSIDEPGETCTFECNIGDEIEVSASGQGGKVDISGSCGGESASCDGWYSCEDRSDERASAGGDGTCKLVEGATGTCSAGPADA